MLTGKTGIALGLQSEIFLESRSVQIMSQISSVEHPRRVWGLQAQASGNVGILENCRQWASCMSICAAFVWPISQLVCERVSMSQYNATEFYLKSYAC